MTLSGFCWVDRFPTAQLQARISNETNSTNPTGFWLEQGPLLLGPGGSWAPPGPNLASARPIIAGTQTQHHWVCAVEPSPINLGLTQLLDPADNNTEHPPSLGPTTELLGLTDNNIQ
jgi:hypothetical protein